MGAETSPDVLLANGFQGQGLPLDKLKSLYNQTDGSLAYCNPQGFYTLQIATAKSRADFVEYAFEKHPEKIVIWLEQFAKNGLGLLHILARFGSGNSAAKILDLLLQHGANINTLSNNQDKLTPVYQAVIACNEDMVRLFLSKSANPNISGQTTYNFTAIKYAFTTSVSDKSKMEALRRIRVQFIEKFGTLLLYRAVLERNIAYVKALLEHKDKFNIDELIGTANSPAYSSFVIALLSLKEDFATASEILCLLIAAGCNLNGKFITKDGDTFDYLEYMALMCNESAFKAIYERDKNIILSYRHEPETDCDTLLHIAAVGNNVQIMGPHVFLSEVLGVDALSGSPASSGESDTPLQAATEAGNFSNVTTLLWIGADPHKRVNGGLSAYQIAEARANVSETAQAVFRCFQEKFTQRLCDMPNTNPTALVTSTSCHAAMFSPAKENQAPSARPSPAGVPVAAESARRREVARV